MLFMVKITVMTPSINQFVLFIKNSLYTDITVLRNTEKLDRFGAKLNTSDNLAEHKKDARIDNLSLTHQSDLPVAIRGYRS